MKKTERKIGYLAISRYENPYEHKIQNIEFDTLFVDRVSVKNSNRPELRKMVDEFIRDGDHVYVNELSGLGWSMTDLYKIINNIVNTGAKISFIKENFTFSKDCEDEIQQKNMFEILTFFAEFESSLVKKKQREGIGQAKAAGKHLGRPRKISKSQREEIFEEYIKGKTPTQLSKLYNISRGSVYNIVYDLQSGNLRDLAQNKTVNIENKNDEKDKHILSPSLNIVGKDVAFRLAREMADKYEKKYSPVFEELFTAIIDEQHSNFDMVKEEVIKHTGYSPYKSSYFMRKILAKLHEAGLISIKDKKGEEIVWK